MTLTLPEAVAILGRTPMTLAALLRGLPAAWSRATEGGETWSAFDVVGHLIHGERTDWIPRARTILQHGERHPFEPFDRLAQRRTAQGRALDDLLDEFRELRAANLAILEGWQLGEPDLMRSGVHPDLGRVTLGQLIATWTVHDLGHIAQIVRTMARRCDADVGPWKQYLRILGA